VVIIDAPMGSIQPYTVRDDVSVTIGSLRIANSSATLAIQSNKVLTSNQVFLNAGTIAIDSSGADLATGFLQSLSGSMIDVSSGGALTFLTGNAGSFTLGGMLETTAGTGVIAGAGPIIAGTGTIVANGGTLDIKTGLTVDKNGHTPRLEVTNLPGSTLKLESTIAPGTGLSFLYGSGAPAGTLLLGTATAQQSFENNGTITGMQAGNSATLPTDVIDLAGVAPTSFTSGALVNGTTIDLFNGASVAGHFTLAAAQPAGTSVGWISDGAGGTDVFLWR
jgi:hypothetical protein